MSQPASDSILANRHYVTLILRLTLDQGGRLIQGELVDTTNTLQKPFIGWTGLTGAVQDCLRQHEQDEAAPEP